MRGGSAGTVRAWGGYDNADEDRPRHKINDVRACDAGGVDGEKNAKKRIISAARSSEAHSQPARGHK